MNTAIRGPRRGAARLRSGWWVGLGLVGALAGCHRGLRTADREELLWPDGAPGALGDRPHDRPRLYYFLPPESERNGTAVVVASGGSYGHHGGLTMEGVETARWLVEQGIAAVVLRYRVHGPRRYGGLDFLADGQRAVRTVRARADELGIEPDRIGMMGFSAGGHLASNVSITCAEDDGRPDAEDPVARESCRLAFAVMVYPVITLDDRYAHRRSRRNMLGGTVPVTPELERQLSTHTQVTARTAPGFVVHSRRDRKVRWENSQLYYDALVRNGVPARLLLFDDGGHGVGVALDAERMPEMSTWAGRWLDWMRELGMLPPGPASRGRGSEGTGERVSASSGATSGGAEPEPDQQ